MAYKINLIIKHSSFFPLQEDTERDVVMWESCAITYYLLDLFDPEEKMGPRITDPKFLASLHQFTFYCSGTVDNLMAISSPIQRVVENKKPGEDPELVDLVTIVSFY